MQQIMFDCEAQVIFGNGNFVDFKRRIKILEHFISVSIDRTIERPLVRVHKSGL